MQLLWQKIKNILDSTKKIDAIKAYKTVNAVTFDELSETLPISAVGLRAAFSRGQVKEYYLDNIIERYGIDVNDRPKPGMLHLLQEIKELIVTDHSLFSKALEITVLNSEKLIEEAEDIKKKIAKSSLIQKQHSENFQSLFDAISKISKGVRT